jgi:hypothetical protein
MPFNQALRDEWEEAGYPRDMGSAAVCRPPPPGFRRAYHLTTADHALSNIVFGRLKVARFAELNDPFELLAPTGGEGKIRKLLSDHKKRVNDEIGLLCFSGDWTNPLLWAHYGSRHKGVALGFDISETEVVDVQYEKERVPIPENTTAVSPALFQDLVRIKFESWCYEEECRLLAPLTTLQKQGDLYFYEVGPKMRLVEIILGELCSLEVSAVRRIQQQYHPNANTFKARRANKYFKMVPNGNTSKPAKTCTE